MYFFAASWRDGSPSVAPEPAASTSLENLLETQILGSHSDQLKQKLQVRAQRTVFSELLVTLTHVRAHRSLRKGIHSSHRYHQIRAKFSSKQRPIRIRRNCQYSAIGSENSVKSVIFRDN